MRPETEQDLAAAVRDAPALCIRGGGTRGLETRGEVLDTGGLSGVELYEPGALTIVLRAGTTVDEIVETLAAEKQRLAFEPRNLSGLLDQPGTSTIGGVVATNSFGPRRLSAGSCADHLLGVRFVDGRGDIIKNGGRVMKNVTGYDLVKLMAGSHGTLGILSEVSLKVLPVPETEATLKLAIDDAAKAVAVMARAVGSPYEVSGAAYLPGQGVVLRIEGFEDSVRYRAAQLCTVLPDGADAETENDPAKSATLWKSVRDVGPFHQKAGDVWRVRLKPSDAPDAIALADAEGFVMDQAGGELWFLTAAGTDLRSKLAGLRYDAVRIRGREGAAAVFAAETNVLAAIKTRLRAEFDPRGVLNPGLMG